MTWVYDVQDNYNMEIDKKNKDDMLKALDKQKEKHGERYCPCKLEKIEDNICPCVELRNNKQCHCGLFKSKEK